MRKIFRDKDNFVFRKNSHLVMIFRHEKFGDEMRIFSEKKLIFVTKIFSH